MIRSLNLLFIALTQFLFQYCIVMPALQKENVTSNLTPELFILLVFASVCIAAAGYIINDYFDLNIDRVNKPDRVIIDKVIRRRWAIVWHFVLSGIGILLTFYVGWKIHNIPLGFANILCVALLWFYSTTFKKRLLIGNIIISLLTAWVVLILYIVQVPLFFYSVASAAQIAAISKIFKLAALYGGFAFISSLIREAIKDVEDMPGDLKYGCRTMPIVWGINVSKVFIATWLIVLLASLFILQAYVLHFRWWWSAVYCFVLIILPLLYIFRKLFKAQDTASFHKLSNWVKLVMLTGIVSMVFFKLYTST